MLRRLIELIAVPIIGLFLAIILGLSHIGEGECYDFLVYSLLSVGLYGSVYGINLDEIKGNRRIILSAVTIGVFLKVLIIGSLLSFFIKPQLAFIFSVAVAQIDPLSVASIFDENKSKLSKRGKLILSAWSSFDDPITALLSVFIVSYVMGDTVFHEGSPFLDYFLTLICNLLFAFSIYLLYKIFKKMKYFVYILLIVSIIISAYFHLMLSIALIGLFLRPYLNGILSKALQSCFYASLLILGILLNKGICIKEGILLGCFAFLSQIIVGYILTYKLSKSDRIYISLAQQNGITAIILALLFEPIFTGTVAIIAPAIFVINILNGLTNASIENKIF